MRLDTEAETATRISAEPLSDKESSLTCTSRVPRNGPGECFGEGSTYDKKVDLPHSASPSNSTVISGVSMRSVRS